MVSFIIEYFQRAGKVPGKVMCILRLRDDLVLPSNFHSYYETSITESTWSSNMSSKILWKKKMKSLGLG